jgi:hypothetical protein
LEQHTPRSAQATPPGTACRAPPRPGERGRPLRARSAVPRHPPERAGDPYGHGLPCPTTPRSARATPPRTVCRAPPPPGARRRPLWARSAVPRHPPERAGDPSAHGLPCPATPRSARATHTGTACRAPPRPWEHGQPLRARSAVPRHPPERAGDPSAHGLPCPATPRSARATRTGTVCRAPPRPGARGRPLRARSAVPRHPPERAGDPSGHGLPCPTTPRSARATRTGTACRAPPPPGELKGGGFAGRLSTVSVPPNARADPSVS